MSQGPPGHRPLALWRVPEDTPRRCASNCHADHLLCYGYVPRCEVRDIPCFFAKAWRFRRRRGRGDENVLGILKDSKTIVSCLERAKIATANATLSPHETRRKPRKRCRDKRVDSDHIPWDEVARIYGLSPMKASRGAGHKVRRFQV